MKRFLVGIIILFVCASLTAQWNTWPVDINGPELRAWWTSMVAKGDTLHIFYSSYAETPGTATFIKYALSTDDGASWQIEVVDTFTNYDTDNVYMTWWRGGLALDASGDPHVAYTVNKSNVFQASWAMYAYRTGPDTWVRDTIEFRPTSDPMIGYDTDIAIDGSGYPHIVYDYYGGDTRYAFWTGSSWTIRNIAYGSSYGLGIALDNLDDVHIAIGCLSDVRYAYSTDGGLNWTLETIEGSWWHCDIDVDNSNVPHIVYCRLNNDYRHALRLGANSWQTTTIENIGQPNITRPMIYIDTADSIHVAYYPHMASDTLKYAFSTNGGTSWTRAFVCAAKIGNSAGMPSFAKRSDRKFIAYRSEGYKLSYASPQVTGIMEPDFSATAGYFHIKLQWRLEIEKDCLQYLILKKSLDEDNEYFELARIHGSGSSPGLKEYTYIDENVHPGVTYYYKLGVVEEDGSTRWYGPVCAVAPVNKPFLTISPNPFSSSTTIHLTGYGQRAKRIDLTIYDATGRRVREFILYPSPRAIGKSLTHSGIAQGESFILGVTWDGRDDMGQVLPPGIYFLRLKGKPVGKVVKVN